MAPFNCKDQDRSTHDTKLSLWFTCQTWSPKGLVGSFSINTFLAPECLWYSLLITQQQQLVYELWFCLISTCYLWDTHNYSKKIYTSGFFFNYDWFSFLSLYNWLGFYFIVINYTSIFLTLICHYELKIFVTSSHYKWKLMYNKINTFLLI